MGFHVLIDPFLPLFPSVSMVIVSTYLHHDSQLQRSYAHPWYLFRLIKITDNLCPWSPIRARTIGLTANHGIIAKAIDFGLIDAFGDIRLWIEMFERASGFTARTAPTPPKCSNASAIASWKHGGVAKEAHNTASRYVSSATTTSASWATSPMLSHKKRKLSCAPSASTHTTVSSLATSWCSSTTPQSWSLSSESSII